MKFTCVVGQLPLVILSLQSALIAIHAVSLRKTNVVWATLYQVIGPETDMKMLGQKL